MNNRVEHFKGIKYIYFIKFKFVRVYRFFINVYLKTFSSFVIQLMNIKNDKNYFYQIKTEKERRQI